MAVRRMPFAGSSARMVALGMLAPAGSVTVPRITPEFPTPRAKRMPAEKSIDANTPVSALKILTSHPRQLSSSGLQLPQLLRLFTLQERCPIPLLGGRGLTCWVHSILEERDG